MRSLQLINTGYKVISIICAIAMVFCFVAVGLTLFSILTLNYLSISVDMIIEQMSSYSDMFSKFTATQLNGMLFLGLVTALSQGVMFLFARRYFKSQYEAGTPFTADGTNAVRTLGILIIVVGLVQDIASAIVVNQTGIENITDVSNSMPLFFGIVFICLSFIYRYVVEIQNKQDQDSENRKDQ